MAEACGEGGLKLITSRKALAMIADFESVEEVVGSLSYCAYSIWLGQSIVSLEYVMTLEICSIS